MNNRVSNIAAFERFYIILVNWNIIAILNLSQAWGLRGRWFESSRPDQKPVFCDSGVWVEPLIWTYCHNVRCARNAAPLVWRNVMKKKPLLALMLAVVVACLISLYGCGGPTVEQLINEDLTNQLDEIKNNDESFLDGLDKVAGKEFKRVDINTEEYAKSYLEGFDYKIGDIVVDEGEGTATAEVTITCKSMAQIQGDFATKYQEKVAALDGSPSEDELYKLAGQVMLDVTKSAKPRDTKVTFKYSANDDNEWSGDDSNISEMMSAMQG